MQSEEVTMQVIYYTRPSVLSITSEVHWYLSLNINVPYFPESSRQILATLAVHLACRGDILDNT